MDNHNIFKGDPRIRKSYNDLEYLGLRLSTLRTNLWGIDDADEHAGLPQEYSLVAIVFYIARVNKRPPLGSTGCPFNYEHLNGMCARDRTRTSLSRPAPRTAPSVHHYCTFVAPSSQLQYIRE